MKGFKDHDIMGTDPMKEQFAPTEAQPIRQRARMGGDPFVPLDYRQKSLGRTATPARAPSRGRRFNVRGRSRSPKYL